MGLDFFFLPISGCFHHLVIQCNLRLHIVTTPAVFSLPKIEYSGSFMGPYELFDFFLNSLNMTLYLDRYCIKSVD